MMSGEHDAAQGRTNGRITWISLADGRVSRQWEQTGDGGRTWKTDFLGYNTRR